MSSKPAQLRERLKRPGTRKAMVLLIRSRSQQIRVRLAQSDKFAIAIVLAIVILPIVAFAVVAPRLAAPKNAYTDSASPDRYVYQEERRIEVWLAVDQFDPASQVLSYRFDLRPVFPVVGYPINTTLFVPPGTNLRLTYTNFGFETQSVLAGGRTYQGLTGRATTTPLLDADLSSFPFDAYQGNIVIRGWIDKAGDESKDLVAGESEEVQEATENLWGPAQFEYRYPGATMPPDTFDLWISRAPRMSLVDSSVSRFDEAQIQDDVTKGFYVLDVILVRDATTQVIAIGLAVFLVILAGIGFLLFLVTLLGHRRPSLAALVWINSLMFTTIIARSAMPGSPPIGIDLDLRSFLPALLILFVASVGTAMLWIMRRNSIPGQPGVE